MSNWFEFVAPDSTLQQGDILYECPVFFPDPKIDYTQLADPAQVDFKLEYKDVIVMSQSCDIQQGQPFMGVMLCPIANLSSVPKEGHLGNLLNDRIGYMHLLNKQIETENSPNLDYMIIDFSNVYTVPLATLSNWKLNKGQKIPRLLSPYTEAMSQRFGVKMMRVGTDDTTKVVMPELSARWKELTAPRI
ncbi:hypothetical protein QPK24_22090 [Paenibacillus polygoni]|uniref:Uncharacterized protein n=1 Tax=Paenibacillus polygoni TaxID=3050112 RepID=A0ABY8X0I1_9BACL|nr:hypothetical protein [Paenibacillus polygoni]WIV18977.1 hypothetical protein QPK24_22090 [Paenibacillus polygoni]